MGEALDVLEDPTTQMTLASVIGEDGFRRSEQAIPSIPFSDSAHWVRLELACRAPRVIVVDLDYPLIDEVMWHHVRDGQLVRVLKAGKNTDAEVRSVSARGFAFELTCQSVETLYLRLRSKEAMILAVRLWEPDRYRASEVNRKFLYGLLFGSVWFFACFMVIWFLVTRQPVFLAFVCYLLAHSLFQLGTTGLGFQIFWPGEVWWNNCSTAFGLGFNNAAAHMVLVWYCRLDKVAPWMARWCWLMVWYGCAASISVLLLGPDVALVLVGILSICTSFNTIIGSVLAMRSGLKEGLYFLIFLIPLAVSTFVLCLGAFGVLTFNYYLFRAPTVLTAHEFWHMMLGLVLIFTWVFNTQQTLKRQTQQIEANAREKEAHLSRQLSGAQFVALGRQMNPHFLSNQLNDVSYLVQTAPDQANAHLRQLSDFYRKLMRYSIQPLICAQDEEEILREYLAINQEELERYNITLHFKVPAGTLLPSMVFQPLIENAIKHGLSRRRGGGVCVVELTQEGDTLLLSVRDNGPQPSHVPEERIFKEGGALNNVRQRLKILYGRAFSLDVRQSDGFAIEVRIPHTTEPDTLSLHDADPLKEGPR